MVEGIVNQWSGITTTRFVGFDEQLVSEFEKIIQGYYKLPQVEALIQFHADLRTHLGAGPDPHDLQMAPFKDVLISQLFRVYRDRGGIGTKDSMLLDLYQELTIGSMQDHINAVSPDKSAQAPGWRYLFNNHCSTLARHKHLKDTFTIVDSPTQSPTLYLTPAFPRGYYPFQDNPYKLDIWKTKEGTLFFYLLYDFSDVGPEQYEGEVLHIDCENFKFQINYKFDGQKATTISYHIVDSDETVLPIKSELGFGISGFNKIALSFTEDKCRFEDLLQAFWMEFQHLQWKPTSLNLAVPISDSGIGLKEVHYYPVFMPEHKLLYFFN